MRPSSFYLTGVLNQPRRSSITLTECTPCGVSSLEINDTRWLIRVPSLCLKQWPRGTQTRMLH
ncbi:hypothetical protein I7I50_04600 [Histoplasma capsulatum G186AR]|uniref:Uncharacterized protein n=1 Tax=Ajellomyces capsulatus TaxID=5037 RepID=A0A8H7YKF0_AJECA|nr:hypothetical protein I7I52_05509 [Histoplasma capsulatum]QSS75462.1 hypothetical protein I7I50_04600 [Histoplasma capsulatum G186AR]